MLLSYFTIIAYFAAALLLTRHFTQNNPQHKYQQTIWILLSFAILAQALSFSDFWAGNGIIFGLANAAVFVAWLITILLFLASISKPVHALGIFLYPLAALVIIFSLIFPDTNAKIIPLNLASHIFLSMSAYALLTLAVCQSVLLKIQEKHLHERQINRFISKLAPLQTMEQLLFQSLRIGFYLLTLSLISGFVFIDDLFAQHLVHKTTLSLLAWIIFATLVFGRKLFGWRGKQPINAIQVGFGLLLLAYFGSKFVLERLLG
ncbi:MAG: cytochrome c biogenesis protein CcsA [Candidatus Thioglobus sp.]|nr:cytochrome c biogenesis protein CcsA [Candidatus Thioglobus sp.]